MQALGKFLTASREWRTRVLKARLCKPYPVFASSEILLEVSIREAHSNMLAQEKEI